MDRNEAQARWVLARGWLDERAVAWVLEQTRLHPELSFCDVLARHRAIPAQAIAAIRRNSSGEIPAFRLTMPIPMEGSTASGSSLEAPTIAIKAPRPKTAETLFGRYKILEELGRGAMGVVLRAHDTAADREVAIKMLHKQELQAEDLARFEREARTLLSLKHPHILELTDCGVEGGQPYLATEYLEGADLEKRIKEALAETAAPPRFSELRGYFEGIARALARCHEQGILHRDVKPQNIFIESGSGRAVLVDFGLMKRALDGDSSVERLTQTGYMVGTPLYMSPEQFNPGGPFGAVSAASDVWGFGATLFHALTGGPPYPHHSPVEIFRAIRSAKAPRLRQLNPDIPAWLDELCAACLQRVPDKRPSMSEVAGRLKAGEPRRTPKTGRKARLVIAAALLLTGALAAAFAFSNKPDESTRAERPSKAARSLELAKRDSSAARLRRKRLAELGYPGAVRRQINALVEELSEDERERGLLLALCDGTSWRESPPQTQDQIIAIVARRLSGAFRFSAARRHSSGPRSGRSASFLHVKTGYELRLIPGSFHRFRSWEDAEAQERVQLLEPLLDSGLEQLMVFFAFWQYEPKLQLRRLARERLLPKLETGRLLERQLAELQRQAGADEQARFQAEAQVSQRLARFFVPPDRWEELRQVVQSELDSARAQAGEEQHSAYVPPFLLGTYEVSVGDWLKLLPEPELPVNTTWEPPCGPETTALGISESAAGDWLKAAGDGLRLPSRLEWEYGAAAGSSTRYFWGDDPRQAARRCWGYSAMQWEGKRNRQTADGKRILLWPPARCDDVLQANAFGLYSMVGNVEEWCRPIDARGAAASGGGLVMGGHMRTPEAYLSSRYFSLSQVRLGGLRPARSLP